MQVQIGNVTYKISTSGRMSKWTKEALVCYLHGCNCATCYLVYELEYLNNETCRMKQHVFNLVKKYGIPNEIEDLTKKVIENEN